MAKNPVAAQLLTLMAEKCTTICLAADLTRAHDILSLADIAGPHIAIFKIHSDIIENFDDEFVSSLRILAQRHRFLIMEDRRFADKSSVVSWQCRRGLYRIAEWADLFSVHPLVGSCVIEGIRSCLNSIEQPRGIIIVAELPTKDALTTPEYIQQAIRMGAKDDLVVGYECHSNAFDDPGKVQLTPGVKLVKNRHELRHNFAEPVGIVEDGADVVAVGRGIINADDRLAAVVEYKRILYSCYESRIDRPIDKDDSD